MPAKFTLQFRRKALLTIETAADWFQEKQPGLEISFLKDINSAVEFIRKNPEKTQTRYKNVRIKFLKKFNFGIHYIYENNAIFILVVFHTSQSPDKWD